MTRGKIIVIVLIAIGIAIQFISSNRPKVITENKDDLLRNNEIDEPLASLIKTSCYDCHSNETNYPWYAYVAPISWLVSNDTRKGRHHLNFSEWKTYNKLDQAKMLSEIADEVKNGEMPMPVYLVMHPKAKLSDEEKKQLIDWTDQFGNNLFK